jgi:hypothetical protein
MALLRLYFLVLVAFDIPRNYRHASSQGNENIFVLNFEHYVEWLQLRSREKPHWTASRSSSCPKS